MAEMELQEKQVEEIAKTYENKVPNNFMYEQEAKVDCVNQWMDDISIDFSLLFDSSSSKAHLELEKLHSALIHWGCFQVINHGISSTFLDEVREVSKQFFNLPLEEKRNYSRTSTTDLDGYGNDTVFSKTQILDWSDRLFLTVYPESEHKLQYWPEKPIAFREIINEYTMKLRMIFEPLLKVMALSLSLEENCFLKEHGESVRMAARFSFYPSCSTPENVIGFKPHSDSSTVTMVLQDKEVEGLQVIKDDQWFRVPTVPDALFINVGDLLEIMSNGILKSPVHRVVINSDQVRTSVAVFFLPESDREVGPVSELITDKQSQMYKRVSHYEDMFFEYYQLGQRPLHAVRM